MPYPKKLLNDYETVAVDLHPHWWHFAEPVSALVGSIPHALPCPLHCTPDPFRRWFQLPCWQPDDT